jgi:hypothetical protein
LCDEANKNGITTIQLPASSSAMTPLVSIEVADNNDSPPNYNKEQTTINHYIILFVKHKIPTLRVNSPSSAAT